MVCRRAADISNALAPHAEGAAEYEEMKLEAYDLRTQRRIAIHGEEWDKMDIWQLGREAYRSVKTGWIFWWGWRI